MASATWPAFGTGTLSGPASATTNALAKFSDATGDNVVGTGIIVDASNNVTGIGTLTSTGDVNGATPTEMGYLSGVTSAIQTQLNSKLALAGGALTGYVTAHADPTNALHLATKQYVDAAIDGVKVKKGVKAASTANLTLSGQQTVDGVALVDGDRILVKDQTASEENGVYVVSTGAWSRAPDIDTAAELNNALVTVSQGTSNANTGWYQAAEVNNLGSDSVSFQQFFGAGTYTADGTTLSLSGSTFSVATGGITNTQISTSAAVAYSKLNLSGSIVNADISNSAAIAYSKLNLSGSIVNADVSSSAAIDGTKISPNFGSQNISTTGTLTAGATTLTGKLDAEFSIAGTFVAEFQNTNPSTPYGVLIKDAPSAVGDVPLLEIKSGATRHFVVRNNGNVGIGTLDPAFTLGSGLEIERNGPATLRLEDSSTGLAFEITQKDRLELKTSNTQPVLFFIEPGMTYQFSSSSPLTNTSIAVMTVDNGQERASLYARHNSHGASGSLMLRDISGTKHYLWMDDNGTLRRSTNVNDVGGFGGIPV